MVSLLQGYLTKDVFEDYWNLSNLIYRVYTVLCIECQTCKTVIFYIIKQNYLYKKYIKPSPNSCPCMTVKYIGDIYLFDIFFIFHIF